MRLITLDRCQPGVPLGKSILNQNGKVLLAEGTILSESLILKLKKYHVFTVYIKDEESEGIEIVESIPEELRTEAVNVITEGLQIFTNVNSTPSNIQGMFKTGRAVRSFQKIFKDILNCLTTNKQALNLLATTKVHDTYVYNHSVNVAIYACQLALENGLPLNKIEEIGLGAMLHDVGNTFISNEVLNKPGKLTTEEYEYVKSHAELGFEVLRKVHEIPLPVAHCALQHHERIDGTGYPRGLKGEEIHNYAKILNVADVFDALTNHRTYRQAILPHKAMEILYVGSGTQFDPKQVQLFKGCIAIYPQGLTVKLNDGRTGLVSNYNFNAVGRPEIRIIKDEENQSVTPYEIDLSALDNLSLEIIEADGLFS